MEKVVRKLEKKFPNSEIIIREGKIFLRNPATGNEDFVGNSTGSISGISLNKNPLYKSSSWVNVSNTGIPSFSSFGKISRRRKLTGTELGKLHAMIVIAGEKENPVEKFNQKIHANLNETKVRNILDTGNYRGEILGKTDMEIYQAKFSAWEKVNSLPEKSKIITPIICNCKECWEKRNGKISE